MRRSSADSGFGLPPDLCVAITAWEIIHVTFFSEGIHPSVSVGLYVLLGGAVLYLVAVALWSIGRKPATEQEVTE